MSDLLLIVPGLMKGGLLISVLVLVSAWPGGASAAAAVIQQCSLLFAGLVGAATANCYEHMRYAETSAVTGCLNLPHTDEPGADPPSPEPVSATDEDRDDLDSDVKPLFNIDGTPMFGDIDANGNPYGLTGSPFDRSDSDDTWSLFDY